ncbi:MAG: PaaI family thioesterase [Actinomycetia bacterium]|nr:PaaI family thioesterase [Actinomycetes bacterium]
MRHEPQMLNVDALQKISRMCFVCGQDNHMSLQSQFLELENGRLCAVFRTVEEHQSYPGRVHGGVISAVMDETIGRVVQIKYPEVFGVTIELNVKFRQPVPLNQELRVLAWELSSTAKVFDGQALLLLADNTVAAEATARYLRQPLEGITADGLAADEWFDDTRPYPERLKV